MTVSPLPPNSWIGILGGGQLGRMAALAAAPLGYRVHIFTPENDGPASQVAARTTVASFDDTDALKAFAAQVDVVTLEFENVPLAAVKTIEAQTRLCPGPKALEIAQHRAVEKQTADELGLTPVPWRPVTNLDELTQAVAALGVARCAENRTPWV
ncbi:MAG: hypothetical protein AAF213_06430 [Pseudomonadota bacterium]